MVLWFHIICCSVVISAIFLYYVSILVLLFALFLFSSNIIDLVPYKWYQSTFLGRKLWVNFFRVNMYSNILQLQRCLVTHINPWSGSNTHRKYKWYLSAHMLVTLVTPLGTPSSGTTSDNTYIQIKLDLLKPSIDKPIGHLTVIVPPRTKLRKILSSTWVVR
jgi:hypothetical protein